MKTRDAKLVTEYIGRIVEMTELGEGEANEKVYHELRDSYSWSELLEEVNSKSEIGEKFVETLENAASEEGMTLKKFLATW